MKKYRFIAIVLCMFLLAGCGSNVATVQETPSPAVTEENSQATDTEEKVAEDTAVPIETAKVTEAVTNETKDTASTDKADATEAVTPEANTDELQINLEDIKALETPITMFAQKQVNIRKGPDTKFDKLGTLSLNDEVSVIGESKSSPWKEIKYNGICTRRFPRNRKDRS